MAAARPDVDVERDRNPSVSREIQITAHLVDGIYFLKPRDSLEILYGLWAVDNVEAFE